MREPSVPAWFEIPSTDFDRARRFYEQLLDTSLKVEGMRMKMAIFPAGQNQPTGAILEPGPQSAPASQGTVIYLNLKDIRPALARVDGAGGAVLVPLTELPGDMGVFAQIRDTEGNRVGLYSRN
ncbi:MAG: VOC family protein [Nannocystaceae bacterium]